jgi:hypothetical protein
MKFDSVTPTCHWKVAALKHGLPNDMSRQFSHLNGGTQ